MGRGGTFQLVRLFGIRVGADPSWFLILFLAIFWLQDGFRETDRRVVDDGVRRRRGRARSCSSARSCSTRWATRSPPGARASRSTGIDLFLFGGVMRMRSEPQTPGAEFRVAAAGPLGTAIIIGAATLVGDRAGRLRRRCSTRRSSTRAPTCRSRCSSCRPSWLVNIFLLVFNLVPAYPLDGGRIVRAAVWKLTGDRTKATRFAAALGRAFAGAADRCSASSCCCAAPSTTASGSLVLGYLLGQSARGALVQTAFTERLEGVTVADIMDAEPVAIPADGDRPARVRGLLPALRLGLVRRRRRRGPLRRPRLPRADPRGRRRHQRPCRRSASSPAPTPTAASATTTPLESLVSSEPLRRLGALMAVDADGRLLGVVTFEQVTRALRARLVAG